MTIQAPTGEPLPKVTICISTYYPGSTLQRVLDSIEQLDYPTDLVDVLVTLEPDDEQSQRIIEKTNSESHKISSFISHSRSASATRNLGLRNSSSEIILALDDDILVPRGILTESVRVLLKEEQIGALVFGVLMEEPSLDERLYHLRFLGVSLSSTYTVTPCSVFRKSALTTAGFYRDDMGPPLSIYEDWELGSRLVKRGFKVFVDGNLFATHLRKEASRHSLKTTVRGHKGENSMLNLVFSYINNSTKNHWAFFQVMHSSPASQQCEYAFYFLTPYIFLGFAVEHFTSSLLFIAGIITFVVVNGDVLKHEYRTVNLKNKFVYPVMMFIIRMVRTNLAVWFSIGKSIRKPWKRRNV